MNPPLPATDEPRSTARDDPPGAGHLPGLTQPAELPPEPLPDDDNASPGQRLRRAREARRLEPGRVAHELRLKPSVILALERDDYTSLPGPVFAGGYLRSYARLLGLDPEPLIEGFRRRNPDAETPPQRMTPAEEVESGGGFLVPLFSGLIVVALLAGVYLWWQHRELAPATVGTPADAPRTRPPVTAPVPVMATPPTTVTAPAAAPPGAPTLAPATDPAGGAAPPDSPAPTAVTTGSATAPREAVAPTTAGPTPSAPLDAPISTPSSAITPPLTAPAPAVNGEVALTFTGPSWVDVRDASGEFRLFGEMASGERRVLGGEPPYSFIIGNASAVAITVGGAPFDLNTVARGNVARFRLNPAEVSAGPATAPPQPAD